jgi:hypothetical protein
MQGLSKNISEQQDDFSYPVDLDIDSCADDTSSSESGITEESTSICDILPDRNIFQPIGDISGDITPADTSMNFQENRFSTRDFHFATDEIQPHEGCQMLCCANGVPFQSAKSAFDFFTISKSDLLSECLRILSGSALDEAFSSAADAYAKCQCVAFLIEHKHPLVKEDEYELVIEKAELLFRKGIDYLDNNPELQLRCCYHLGRLLRAHGCRHQSGEICHLLCTVISMNVRFPTDFILRCKCVLSGAIKEFSNLYRQIDEEFWRTITETLDELSKTVSKTDEKPFLTGYVLSFEIRYSVIALAGQFSENLEFAVAKLLLFVPDTFDPLSAYVYLQRCLNYQRQYKLQKSFRELQNASRALFTNLPRLPNHERTILETCNYLGLVLASLRNVNNDELRLPIKMRMKRAIDEWLHEHVSRNKLTTFPDKESILDSLMFFPSLSVAGDLIRFGINAKLIKN